MIAGLGGLITAAMAAPAAAYLFFKPRSQKQGDFVAAADLTRAAAVTKVAEAIRSKHGRLDILVNNAGTNIPNRTWAQLSPGGIDTLIAGN